MSSINNHTYWDDYLIVSKNYILKKHDQWIIFQILDYIFGIFFTTGILELNNDGFFGNYEYRNI